ATWVSATNRPLDFGAKRRDKGPSLFSIAPSHEQSCELCSGPAPTRERCCNAFTPGWAEPLFRTARQRDRKAIKGLALAESQVNQCLYLRRSFDGCRRSRRNEPWVLRFLCKLKNGRPTSRSE